MTRSRIVVLCGSTRFKEEFEAAAKAETLAGRIVLSVGYFGHKEETPPTEEQKRLLDRLHFEKIMLADEALILNKGGYIGTSTRRELQLAANLGIPVRFLEPDGAHVPAPCERSSLDDGVCIECCCGPGARCDREDCLHCAMGMNANGTDWA